MTRAAMESLDLARMPTVLQAAAFLGVPSIIALFLVWVLTQAIAGRLSALEQGQQRLERLIRNACVVAASSPEERSLCGAP